jgi:NitT/TauT family transport system substrate-binding protein
VPEEYFIGDRALYINAFKASSPMYSKTGLIPDKGMQNANDMLVQFDKEVAAAKVDLKKTFDDRFVKKASASK